MASRRKFIKNGALAAGAFMIVPRHVLGRGYLAPSDKLNIVGVGAGGKGTADLRNSWNDGENNVVGLCDIDWDMCKDNLKRFPKAEKFQDWRVMLDKLKDFDAVTVSTPDHTHAPVALAAMQLGKHVYVQKPLTHNVREAHLLYRTAKENKVVASMGNQGASCKGTQQISEWIDQKLIGNIHTVHIWTDRPVWPQGNPLPTDKMPMKDGIAWDNWVGPAPYVDFHTLYHPFKWRGWWPYGTGALGDMGCHLFEPAVRGLHLESPTEIECSVGTVFIQDWNPVYAPDSCPASSTVQYRFPKTSKNDTELTLTWSDGGIKPFRPAIIPSDDPVGNNDHGDNGLYFIGEKGVISCGIFGLSPRAYLFDGNRLAPELKENNLPDYGHHISWARACKAGFGSAEHEALPAKFDMSVPLTEIVLLGNVAIRSSYLRREKLKGGHEYFGRKRLMWDGKEKRITNLEEANQFVSRTYRKGWEI